MVKIDHDVEKQVQEQLHPEGLTKVQIDSAGRVFPEVHPEYDACGWVRPELETAVEWPVVSLWEVLAGVAIGLFILGVLVWGFAVAFDWLAWYTRPCIKAVCK